MLRLIFILLFVFLFLILSVPVMLAEYIVGRFNPDLKCRSSLAIVNWAFRCIRFLAGTRVDYIGLENVPADTPVLYVGNHRSFFDIILTYPMVPRPTGYISKKELAKIPLLSIWMRNINCLFLDRDNIKAGMQTILQAIDMMKNGKSVCIFPEGTRSKKEGEILPFHEGSFKIAVKSGCPIVPITINNSAEILENHFPFIKKAHVIIEYGKPVYPSSLPKEQQKQLAPYFREIIIETHRKNLPNL